MHIRHLPLPDLAPGVRHSLQVLQFGASDAEPKAFIQAALHADEIPPLLVAQHLREQLSTLEASGQLHGQVVLVPMANPIGLSQQLLGQHQGRFDLADGVNFNRQYADLGETVHQRVQERLGTNAAANVALIRQALREGAAELQTLLPAQALKHALLRLAIDADVVLDLHCDAESTLHLYALTQQSAMAAELGALMGARAILLAEESGDSPFDEACSRPWLVMQRAHPDKPIPLHCFSATVELRGRADVDHASARQDAAALIDFLRRRGIVGGALAPMPAALCEPTPLAGSEPITAPHAGIVVFHAEVGASVAAGEVIAELVDPATGAREALCAQSAGVLYARSATRWAWPGARLAKVAGHTLQRSGKLLSN